MKLKIFCWGVNIPGIIDPHGRTVKVDQHPLVRVKIEGVRILYAVLQKVIVMINQKDQSE